MTDHVYGFTCSNCRADFDRPQSVLPTDGVDRNSALEYLAGLEGYGIGHFDGQGEIVCGDCINAVWDYCRFGKPLFPSPSLSAWLFQYGVVSTTSWTGRDEYSWTPARTFRHKFYRFKNQIMRLLPWRPIESGEPPRDRLLRVALSDGSIFNKVLWTDHTLRRGLPDGWFDCDTHAPVGDEASIMKWKFA